MPAPLEIKVLNIASVGWAQVSVPFDCSSISVKNTAEATAVRMRTTSNDASTEDVLAPGREQAFAVPFHRYRFLAGSNPVWLQTVESTASVVVKFLASLICAVLLTGTARGQLSQAGLESPQSVVCTASQQIAVTTQGTVQMVAAVAGKSVYVCGFTVNSGGTTTAQLVQGQGVNCATNKTNLTPAFKMTNGSTVTMGGAVGQVLKLAAGNALCLTTTSNPDVGVLIVYVQR